MDLRHFNQILRSVSSDKLLRGGIDCGGSSFREFHPELLFQPGQTGHEFITSKDRRCRHRQIFFGFVPLHQFDLPAQTHQCLGNRLFV